MGALLRISTPLALILALLSFSGTALGAEGESRAILYIELPATVESEVVLRMGAIELVGEEATVRVRPGFTEWSSTELAGRQRMLAEMSVPAGIYQELRFHPESIQLRIGSALVEPTLPADGFALRVDLDVPPSEAELLRLRWLLPPFDPEVDETYQPAVELLPLVEAPLGSTVFVSNENAGYLSVADRLSHRIVDAIWVGDKPRGMAYSDSEQRLYVALAGADQIAIVDATNRALIRTVNMRYGDEPSRLRMSPDEFLLFALNHGTNTVTVFDLPSVRELARIPVGVRPREMAYDGLSEILFVSSEMTGEILLYDVMGRREVGALEVDSIPTELLFEPIPNQLYVASASRRRLLVLNGSTHAIVEQFNLCGEVAGLAYHRISRRLYAAIPSCNEIAVLRPSEDLHAASITLPAAPGLMIFGRDQRELWVTLPKRGQVAICSPNGNRVTALLDVSARPYGVIAP